MKMSKVLYSRAILCLVCAILFVLGLVTFYAPSASAAVPFSVDSLTLITANTSNSVDIQPLNSTNLINLCKLPSNKLSIRANTSPNTVTRVNFSLDSNQNYNNEFLKPYTLRGLLGYVRQSPELATVGQHTVTATPYIVGIKGASKTAVINVINDCDAPTTPAHQSPSNNSYTTTGNQTLIDWSSVTDSSEPVKYRYQAAYTNTTNQDGSFTNPVYSSELLLESQIPTPNTPQGVYYWHVKAVDNAGNESAWSNPWKITVDNTAPSTPSMLGYINPALSCGAVTNNHNSTIDWSDSTDNNGIAGYDYFVDYPTSNGLIRNQWQTFLINSHYGGSLNEGYHDIKVRAKDLAGNLSDWTSMCRITADWTAPEVPQLISPSNNAVANGLTLTNQWSGVSDATNYIYESYHDAAASNLRWHQEFSTTSKTATNVANTTFWWRVKAVDAANNESQWSDLWKVTVDNDQPSTPEITSPTNNQYFKNAPIVNQWSASTDNNSVAKYQVEYIYDDGHTFNGGPYRDVTAPQTSRNHSPTTAEQGGVVIRVRAIDSAGNQSNWSQPVHYFYDSTAPLITQLGDINQVNELDMGGAYVSFGTNATDNLDTNILADCSAHSGSFFAVGETAVNCYATDNAGNTATLMSFKVTVIDSQKPQIKINGNENITLTVGDVYSDLGAMVLDNFDGSFSANAVSNVNTNSPGTYTVNYTALDSSGNSAVPATRNVTVLAKPVLLVTQAVTTLPAPIFRNLGVAVAGGIANEPTDTTTNVLGEETTKDSNNKSTNEVLGATAKVATTKNFLGFAWYWWLLALVIVGSIVIYLVLKKEKNGEEI